MRVINRRRITIKDSERKNLHDHLGGSAGYFRPKTNRVLVQSRDISTGEVENVTESTNLIVYHGRSWLMQRAFGFPLGAIGDSTTPYPWTHTTDPAVGNIHHTNFENMYINWFAVGSGGANEASLLEPYDTSSVEYQLGSHINIGGDDGANPAGGTINNLRYHHPTPFGGISSVTRDYHQFDPQYPQYLFDPDVVPGEGGTEDSNYLKMETADSTADILYGGFKVDSYMRALIRVTLSPEECNGPGYYNGGVSGEDYSYLNEAGLFVSRSYDADDSVFSSLSNEVQMFAKVNFSSIRKDDTRELIFSWYIYF